MQPGHSSMKTRSQRPQHVVFVYCSMASSSSGLYSNSSNVILLTEDDIPGASLLGRKPEELKTPELRLWLKCHGDSCKGLKMKAELVKRVHEYIRTAKTKMSLTRIRIRFIAPEKSDRVPLLIVQARMVFQCNFLLTV